MVWQMTLHLLSLHVCVTASAISQWKALPAHWLVHMWLLPCTCTCARVTCTKFEQDGVKETGVSVAFTVKAMDAGPILVQEALAVDDVIQAPELLSQLFRRGTQLLLQSLPLVASGTAAEAAQPQVACAWCDVLLWDGTQC